VPHEQITNAKKAVIRVLPAADSKRIELVGKLDSMAMGRGFEGALRRGERSCN
jgi:hypothetical protein